jgi:hypothetical protein
MTLPWHVSLVQRHTPRHIPIAQTASYTFWDCYAVNNFTDANNWMFTVVRDDSVNTQNC